MIQTGDLEAYREWQKAIEAEALKEALSDDCVYRSITYKRFVSKSKGIRNGKQRIRRNWKDVHLVEYNSGYHYWHNFPFDEYATEIIGQFADGEMLKDRIIELWGY